MQPVRRRAPDLAGDSSDEHRAGTDARRLLELLGWPRERHAGGLMQHEVLLAGWVYRWTMEDVKRATFFAYRAGWIDVQRDLYHLTALGERTIAKPW